MSKKIKILILIIFISFAVNITLVSPVFCTTEEDVRTDTLSIFEQLGEYIHQLWVEEGNAIIFPENTLECSSSQATGNPCWHGSLKNSNSLMTEFFVSHSMPINFSVDMRGFRGDVRYRCRTQGHQTYCFAYHCLDPIPAGCKQVWRIDWKIDVNNFPETPGKCTLLMATSGDGADWTDFCNTFNPDPNAWKR